MTRKKYSDGLAAVHALFATIDSVFVEHEASLAALVEISWLVVRFLTSLLRVVMLMLTTSLVFLYFHGVPHSNGLSSPDASRTPTRCSSLNHLCSTSFHQGPRNLYGTSRPIFPLTFIPPSLTSFGTRFVSWKK